MDFLYSVIGFILAIGVLVVVHEFGHYWVAKRLGVKVLRFSVGFGKPLLTRRGGRDQTEYVLSALPLGGYVKMLDETEGEVSPEERHRAFNRQAIPKRVAIVAAGPVFNFLFAILAYWLVYMAGVEGIKPVVGKVVENSIAEQAGFRAGDEWLSVDGDPARTWDQHRLYLYRKALSGETVAIEVKDAEGHVQTRKLDLGSIRPEQVDAALVERAIGLIGYVPDILPIVGSVQAGGPAAAGGLQVGDRIVEINGKAVEQWRDVVVQVTEHPGLTLNVTVERDSRLVPLRVTPRAVEAGGKTIGKIEAGAQPPAIPADWRVEVELGPLAALKTGVENTWSMSVLTLQMLYKMLKLEVSAENISGPITIAQYAGYSVQIGIDRFLMFLAVVSISLGVLNLLPIPILDGGHLLFYAIEAVKGKPLSEQAMSIGQRIGMAVLFGLMVLAFYNDFARILH